ncbi:MAG: hypothetical protein ACT4PY_12470 [Armatimonadota bacterium]
MKATQDGYLEILTAAPDHRDALRGLVAVRRQLANNDPAVLRQQAAAYRRAIATGIGIADEHYTSEAMTILAAASMRAADEIEGRNTRSAAVTAPAPSALPVAPHKRAISSAQPTREGSRRYRASATPDLDERRGPRYRIQVGPVSSFEQATAVTAILKQAGFAPRLSMSTESGLANFQVVSEVMPRRAGETRGAALAELGFRAQVRRLSGDRVQLHFGTLIHKGNAENLARRVRATGYWATVVGGSATAYVITLGPHAQRTVDAITGIFMTRSRIMSPVTVSPAQ